jgi:riboflavin biosynthesis pyrimidine reductase
MKPHISLNLALSADGKISDPHSRPSGWTSPIDHDRLLLLRRDKDALLVGRRTWLADRMTMRIPDSIHQPLRCLVTRHGSLDPLHPLFHTPGGEIHVLCTESLPTPPHPQNVHFHSGSLDSFLTTLHDSLHVQTLHCEGGGFLVRELLRINAVDTLHLTLAGHTLFSGMTSPTLTGIPNLEFLPSSTHLTLESFEPLTASNECFLTYRRNTQCASSSP